MATENENKEEREINQVETKDVEQDPIQPTQDTKQEVKKTEEITHCLNCGTVLKEGQEFCPKCGIKKGDKKVILCPKCNSEIQIGQKFCPKCGEKIKIDSSTIINSVKNGYQKKVNNMDSKKLKKRIMIVVIVVAIIALIVFGVKTFLPNMFVGVEEFLVVGNYQEAYNKAKKEEKENIYWENVLFYVCKEVRSGYKDPSTFDLREAWIDKDNNKIVLKTGGANSYGGIVMGYDYITFDKEDNKFELWCSLSSLEEEKKYSWDDSSEALEKILKNAARSNVKEIIRDDSLSVDSKVIDHINNLFKKDTYKDAVLIDDAVTGLYVSESKSSE